jgi:hypothetical protein
MRCAAACRRRRPARERVEAAAGGRDDDRHPATERGEADWIAAIGEHHGLGLRERSEAEALAEQRVDESLSEQARIGLAGSPGREVAPVRLRDAPVATDLVTKVEALRDAVVRFALPSGAELAARDSQSGESSPPSMESPSKASCASRARDFLRGAMVSPPAAARRRCRSRQGGAAPSHCSCRVHRRPHAPGGGQRAGPGRDALRTRPARGRVFRAA